MDDYVPKPVGLADLGAAFERVAPIRRAIRDAAPQDAAPQEAAPQEAAPQEAAPQAAAPQEAAPKVAPSEPVGTPGVAQHASVDLGVLAELVDELGDRTIVADLVATFLDELDGRLAAIVEAHAADDRAQLRRLVHTITSSARLLGAASLADRCADFEEHRLDAPALLAAGDAVRTQLVTWSAT
jgi:HPt (histidine-containing phosphotransfer) domain-containing protein